MSTELNRADHAKQRSGMLTSSHAMRLLNGGHKVWNSVLDEIWSPELHAAAFDNGKDTAATAHGKRYEAEASARFWLEFPWYEMQESEFQRFWLGPTSHLYPWVGASPDNLIWNTSTGKGEGLEIKCPLSDKRWKKYVKLSEEQPWQAPYEHHAQCQWMMWITGRELWNLMVYWQPNKEYLLWKVERDLTIMEQFASAVTQFIPHLESGQPFEPASNADLLSQL